MNNGPPSRPLIVWPGPARLTVVILGLELACAALRPPIPWWQLALLTAAAVAALGWWRGQHWSSAVGRWLTMTMRNTRPARLVAPADAGADTTAVRLTARLWPPPAIPARSGEPPPNTLVPIRLLASYLERYGIICRTLQLISQTTTPPLSALRANTSAYLTGATPQQRSTWLTLALHAADNIAALQTRGIGVADLATVTLRHISEALREKGWTATRIDPDAATPTFQPLAAARREWWTAAQYADGFRAIYTIDHNHLSQTLAELPTIAAIQTWTALTLSRNKHGPPTGVAQCALLTRERPRLDPPLPTLIPAAGRHLSAAATLSARGTTTGPGGAPICLDDIAWTAAPAGVPLGITETGQIFYFAFETASGTMKVTVVGSRSFHRGIIGRLALSGQPILITTTDPTWWSPLAAAGAPNQITIGAAETATPDTIHVIDITASTESTDIQPALAVALATRHTRHPADAILEQRHERWFTITTGGQTSPPLNTRLP
jgi:type VII secretion protein EccE